MVTDEGPMSRYCAECGCDVPIDTLENGTVIIHCPKCIGECAACDCHLAAACFGSSLVVLIRPRRQEKEGAES